jgi:hypothetical protein
MLAGIRGASAWAVGSVAMPKPIDFASQYLPYHHWNRVTDVDGRVGASRP